MSITLKKAEIKDIPELVSIEETAMGNKLYSPLLSEAEWLEEFSKNKVYFIQEGEQIVGELSCEMKGPTHTYISGLVVLPQFQGQGIAKRAMGILLGDLSNDVKIVDLVTHPDNIKAIKLYESFGFKIESRIEDYFGDGEPRVKMVLNK